MGYFFRGYISHEVCRYDANAIPTPAHKLADYEEQIHSLRSQAHKQAHIQALDTNDQPTTPTSTASSPERPSSSKSQPPQPEKQQPQTRLATFASYLPYGRRPANTSASQLPLSSPPRPATAAPSTDTTTAAKATRKSAAELGLQDALYREQALRKAAESRLSQTNTELEDLTTTLFSQANEMVAQERKARAKLEERIEVLERRDGEKRRRLERLEGAMERVERVRGLVGGGSSSM